MPSFSRKENKHQPLEPPSTTTAAMSPITEEDRRKDSASLTSPTKPAPQPLPTRTPSTRFHEPSTPTPSRQPSQSIPQRSTSTKKSSTPAANEPTPERPGLQRRRTTAQTRYIDMLLELDDVPKLHNILASLFTWILLAGYIVFPATFTKLQEDKDLDAKANTELKEQVLKTARNIPLLYIAAFACGIGVLGCIWLWWAHRRNYVWVINRIFLPALMNSIAGLISTLVNVYSAQDGQYSVTARATIIVTASCSVVTALLFLLYNTVMLALVKRKHVKETRALDREMSTKEGVLAEREGGQKDASSVV